MAVEEKLFRTQRSRLVELYKDAKQAFEATTKPYISTKPFVWTVIEAFPAGAGTMAHAILRRGQEITFFDFGVGDTISDGLGGEFEAPYSWTNLAEGKNTNGGVDFVIEGVSATPKSIRLLYPENTYKTVSTVDDADLVAAYEGLESPGASPIPVNWADPAALASPPQTMSPFNLEELLYQRLARSCSIEFEWDQQRVEKVGRLDEMPEGGGNSYLRANGQPTTDNRYRIPEGYLWRRQGETDSQFVTRVIVREAVVVPISLVGLFGAVQTPLVIPQKIAMDITVRLHGLNVKIPSRN